MTDAPTTSDPIEIAMEAVGVVSVRVWTALASGICVP